MTGEVNDVVDEMHFATIEGGAASKWMALYLMHKDFPGSNGFPRFCVHGSRETTEQVQVFFVTSNICLWL